MRDVRALAARSFQPVDERRHVRRVDREQARIARSALEGEGPRRLHIAAAGRAEAEIVHGPAGTARWRVRRAGSGRCRPPAPRSPHASFVRNESAEAGGAGTRSAKAARAAAGVNGGASLGRPRLRSMSICRADRLTTAEGTRLISDNSPVPARCMPLPSSPCWTSSVSAIIRRGSALMPARIFQAVTSGPFRRPPARRPAPERHCPRSAAPRRQAACRRDRGPGRRPSGR